MFLKRVSLVNFRAFKKAEIDFDDVTVLIGENNSGKTSVLESLGICLSKTLSKKAPWFEDYDYHLEKADSHPGDSGETSITLDFCERKQNEWSSQLVADLNDIMVFDSQDIRHIIFRATGRFLAKTNDFDLSWSFCDTSGNDLGPKANQARNVRAMQDSAPLFYLAALRDASREFQARSSYWAPLLRESRISVATRTALEEELSKLNNRILDAHVSLAEIKTYLSKAQTVVGAGRGGTVSIDALPGKVFDILPRSQVSIEDTNGSKIPLSKYGAGTQSLAVLFLFEAFNNLMQSQNNQSVVSPVLALEEPEAHLHPCGVRALWTMLQAMQGQKIIATHSGDMIAEMPLSSIRRLCRKNGAVNIHRLQANTLDTSDLRKVKYHVCRHRGELLFARCWLLVEGETEYWLLTRVAEIMQADLEQLGVRIVEYRNVEALPLTKVADDFGIEWFCLMDGDEQGTATLKSLNTQIGTRTRTAHLKQLPHDNAELFLCERGFGGIYEKHMSQQKAKKILTAKPGDAEYWSQVVRCLPNRGPKGQWALEVSDEIEKLGIKSVPVELSEIVKQVQAIARV